jgi:DNA-binding Lrp family transcriptional regulator
MLISVNYKLDKRNKKILMLLDTDATISLSRMAKQLKISKEAVAYRIKKLEKDEIIAKYITLTHFAKTGLIHFKLYLQYSNVNKESKEEIIAYLSSVKNIGWLASTKGSFDLMLSIRFKTIFEFETFKDTFCRKFDKYFQNMEFAILTEAETKPRAYIMPETVAQTVHFIHCDNAKEEKLDDEDIIIIHALSDNARANAAELSKITGLTERIIRYRRQNLENRGIIVGYKLAIDYRKLGYLFFKCFVNFKNLNEKSYDAFRAYIRMQPNIIYWIKTIGSWNAELEIESQSIEEYYDLISEMEDKFSNIIVRIDSTLVSEEHVIKHA